MHPVASSRLLKKMKFCIWTIYPNHYQAAFHDALRDAGVDLRVCYFGEYDQSRRDMGWVQPLRLTQGEYYCKSISEAKALIKDFDQRIQVNTGFYSKIYWQLIRYARKNKFKWVHWSEASSGRFRSLLHRKRYASLVCKSALGAFAIGNMAAEDFMRWGIPASMIEYLPYTTPFPQGIEKKPFGEESSQKNKVIFVFCGTLCERKSLDLILKSFELVSGEFSDVELRLTGNNLLDAKTNMLLNKLVAQGRVKYIGTTPPHKVDSVLEKCDVCLLPSRFDGWGLALAEGARNGLALIGSDKCGASAHLIVPGQSGVVVQAGDLSSLTDAMRSFAANPELINLYGKRARELVEDTAGCRNATRFVSSVERWLSCS